MDASVDYSARFDTNNTAGAFKQTVAGGTYVYTQLEATYARRVFPCVDEPDNKVPWKLTLDVPKALVAVSNTPGSEKPLDGAMKQVEFAQTKPLPTYLVAFGKPFGSSMRARRRAARRSGSSRRQSVRPRQRGPRRRACRSSRRSRPGSGRRTRTRSSTC
jgi:hypothetical protein